jgi:anti-sigma regulatory factor (Ser/Thr protein kinase)
MIAELSLDNDPRSVKDARRFVAERLTGCTPDVVRRVTLMVSELVTNSIRYTKGTVRLTMDITVDALRVAVHDDGPGKPSLRSPGPSEPSGRGLRIVAHSADDWGVEANPSAGNVVWFLVAVPLAPTTVEHLGPAREGAGTSPSGDRHVEPPATGSASETHAGGWRVDLRTSTLGAGASLRRAILRLTNRCGRGRVEAGRCPHDLFAAERCRRDATYEREPAWVT